jgi:tetratricopeptide (TPR) repeat protein
MVRAGFQWVGLTALMVVGSVGCAEQKSYEVPKQAAATSSRPCDAARNGMDALRLKTAEADTQVESSQPGGQPPLLPVEVLRLRHLLQREGLKCYEERLAGIRAIEATNRQEAVEGYESLKSFVATLRGLEVVFPVIDFDGKIAGLKRIAVDAEEAYAAAGEAMQAQNYQEAIARYRRSLDLVSDYKDARQNLAECYYRAAVGAVESRLYRQASQFFEMAEQYQPNYRDSRTRAARIHRALGNYFLAQGYPRNAALEYEASESMLPGDPGVRIELETASSRAHERIAVVGVNSHAPSDIEGISVDEFLTNGILEKLQQKKSQFLEVYTRTQFEAFLAERGLELKDLTDQTTAPELGKLRGLRYLVTERITQVSQKKGAPVRMHRETSSQVPIEQMVTEYDLAGRAHTYPKQVGTRVERIRYNEIAWSGEVTIGGLLEVLDVQTGKIVARRSFDRVESGGGRWAEDPSIPGAQSQPSPAVQTLLQASSPAAIARRAMDTLADELVSAILEKIDGVPSVPDPTQGLAELAEPATPVVLTRPTVRVETVGDAPKAEAAPPQQRVRVKGDAVNVRLKPTTNSQSLGRSKKGDLFPLLSRQEDWVKIRLSDGREGWIAARLVEILPE